MPQKAKVILEEGEFILDKRVALHFHGIQQDNIRLERKVQQLELELIKVKANANRSFIDKLFGFKLRAVSV